MKEYYKVFEVTAIRDFLHANVYAGTKIFACRVPNGHIYLSKNGVIGTGKQTYIFYANAIEDIDFKI